MVNTVLKKIIKNKYWLLVLLVFGLVLLSRMLFLGADLPSTHVEIEEKLVGYNARNMVFLNHWALYSNWYQPMIYGPIQCLLSFLSFRFLGVGLAQFRLPMTLASLVGFFFFFLILLKQTNRTFALLGLILYATSFEITVWNRSALTENLYLLFMPLSVYFLTKKDLKNRDMFFVVFFAGLSIVTKLDGYSFYLAIVLFLFYWSFKTHSFVKSIKAIILGSLGALIVLLILFAFFDAFKYALPMYRFYFDTIVRQGSFLKEIIPTLQKFIFILLSIDPYIVLAFLLSLPILIINRKRLDKTDLFMIIFLLITVITRLQIPTAYMYWKRVIFLFFPIFYVISKASFFLWKQDDNPSKNLMRPKEFLLGLVISSFYSLLLLFFYVNYFGKSIPRLYGFGGFTESFHYTGGSFVYLFFIIIAAISCSSGMLLFSQGDRLRKISASLILFLVLLSLATNGLYITKMFIPENIKYSYQENQKYTKLVPEGEMIVSDEQGFRAFAYLSKNDFYFNHDGGPNPVPYREVFERQDLRYFILNVEEFWREHWGLTNKVRLELIKETYPDLKMIGVFFASKVPLAIYDKYGSR